MFRGLFVFGCKTLLDTGGEEECYAKSRDQHVKQSALLKPHKRASGQIITRHSTLLSQAEFVNM